MTARSVTPALALLLLLAPGCAGSWKTTLEEVVTPLNELLHHEYGQAFKARDLAAIQALHAPDMEGRALVDANLLLTGFVEIDRTRVLIRRVQPHDEREGAWIAHVLLRLDGRDGEGKRHTLKQAQRLTCSRAGGRWRIVERDSDPFQLTPEPGAVFVDESEARGLSFKNSSRGVKDRAGKRRIYFPGSGVTAADVDGDGLDDLLLVAGDALRLFHNTGGQFQDVTAKRGLVTPPTGECRAAFFGDIDNDGDVDLFVAMVEADNLLFLNDGKGSFEPVPESRSRLSSTGQTTSACFADFDGDGNLDLYIVNGHNLTTREPDPIYNAKNGTRNQYFRGKGDGTFEDITDETDVDDSGWGLACSVSDYDRDGDVDLLVANDFGRDILYRNRGDGTFDDVSDDVGLTYRTSSMSADFADINGDGHPDLFISGMASNARWAIRMPGFPARGPFPLNILLRQTILDLMWEMLHGNRLYISRGDGTFREASEESGTRDLEWGWGSLWLDYDHDGDLDLYGVNGFWSGEDDEDT